MWRELLKACDQAQYFNLWFLARVNPHKCSSLSLQSWFSSSDATDFMALFMGTLFLRLFLLVFSSSETSTACLSTLGAGFYVSSSRRISSSLTPSSLAPSEDTETSCPLFLDTARCYSSISASASLFPSASPKGYLALGFVSFLGAFFFSVFSAFSSLSALELQTVAEPYLTRSWTKS